MDASQFLGAVGSNVHRSWAVAAALALGSGCGADSGGGVEASQGDGVASLGNASTCGDGCAPTTGIQGGEGDSTATSDENSSASGSSENSDSEAQFDVGFVGTSGASCDPNAVTDTLEFEFVKSIDLGISTLQAGYFDIEREQIVVFSYFGEGRIFSVDGTMIQNVAAPAEALPQLDGAAYDARADLGLLINQSCRLVEVDPATLTTVATYELGAKFGMSICAGIAYTPDGNLVIASYGTNELVEISRDTEMQLNRVDTLASLGLSGPDGIAEIAGSYNFLVNTTTPPPSAMVVDADLLAVVNPAPVGQPPLTGGGAMGQPDSMLTVCLNGHMWICTEYETTCADFAPKGGDFQACGCLIAG